MSHVAKLTVFFIISVALHGAALWAAAGRYEANEPEAPAGVAIVDRNLFFRHAERTESQASNPVSATERVTPQAGSAIRPTQTGESIAAAAPSTADAVEPERRAPASPAPGAMARLDPSAVEPAPTPRRQASAPEESEAERREPVRMSGVDATAPTAAVSRQAHSPVPIPLPARTSEAAVEAARQPSIPVSAPNRITPRSASALRPSERGERIAGASAATADEAEPERRASAGPTPGVMARLDPSAVDPAPPFEALRPTGAARRASLVIAPPLQRAGELRVAARARVPEPEKLPQNLPDSSLVRQQLETAEQLRARAAEPVTKTAPDAPSDGLVDTLENSPAGVPQVHAAAPAATAEVERSEPEAAPSVSTAEAPRLAPPDTRALADRAARDEIAPRPTDRPTVPVTAATTPAEAALASPAVPAQAPRDRPELRGTLPAPLLSARPADVPEPTPPRSEGPRLRRSLADDIAPSRADVAAARPEAVQSAEPSAAPPPAPAPRSSVPDPAPLSTAEPRQLAALAPETPARRLESSESQSGRNDPVDRFTRAYQGGECFFPLRLASRDGAAILGYGLKADSVDMFRQAFAQALGTQPDIDWRPLTDAQCAGISFTRLILGDSAPSVRIALERKSLDVGQNLAGRVTGSRLEFVTLLVVDDSGAVHNVLDHLMQEGSDLVFDIPVQPVDDGTDRVQLLMAVGASRPLDILQSTVPVHSDDFFPALRDQAVEAGAFLELGLADFVILGRGT